MSGTRGANSQLRWRTGFSLVELVIAIAMIGILAAILTPQFLGLRARSAVNEATQQLARDVERIRLDARRANRAASIVVSNEATTYRLEFANGTSSTVQLPPGTRVQTAAATPIEFEPPYGTIGTPPISGVIRIDLEWTGRGAAPNRTVGIVGVMGKVVVQ